MTFWKSEPSPDDGVLTYEKMERLIEEYQKRVERGDFERVPLEIVSPQEWIRRQKEKPK